jgi:hypothetical protein
MKIRAKARAEESRNTGKGMDICELDTAKEIGAVHLGESDVKFDETVFEFINSAWREYGEQLYYDAVCGEAMTKELVESARKVKMEKFKKRGVHEKAPTEECWKETGKGPAGVKWVDTNKGDKEKPEYRCRLVEKEIKKDKREDLFAAMPPLEAKRLLLSLWASVPGM